LAIVVKMRRLESTTGRNESLGGRFLAVQNLRAFVSGDQYALFEAWDPCELKPAAAARAASVLQRSAQYGLRTMQSRATLRAVLPHTRYCVRARAAPKMLFREQFHFGESRKLEDPLRNPTRWQDAKVTPCANDLKKCASHLPCSLRYRRIGKPRKALGGRYASAAESGKLQYQQFQMYQTYHNRQHEKTFQRQQHRHAASAADADVRRARAQRPRAPAHVNPMQAASASAAAAGGGFVTKFHLDDSVRPPHAACSMTPSCNMRLHVAAAVPPRPRACTAKGSR
jgi:hypothetical protein